MVPTLNFFYKKLGTIWHNFVQSFGDTTITITFKLNCKINLINYFTIGINTICSPIILLNFNPCISMLDKKPSATASASILVAPLFQFKKHLWGFGDCWIDFDLSQITQYLFRIPTNNIFLVRKPIIVAWKILIHIY